MAKKEDGSPQFKRNTIADMIRFLKRFYLWLIENNYSTVPEAKVRKKIQAPAYERMTKTAEQLLGEDEVLALIQASRTSRDRALISVLYESGCRIGELAALTWDDVRFTENQTAAINTAGKTGRPRYIPLVTSRSYLAGWKADYPGNPSGASLVFVTTTTHGPLQYAGVVKQLRAIAARAGIEKHITPHLFRHSRITHLLRKGVPEPVIKKLMWGHINTGMLQTYGHLVDRDIDDAIRQLYGVVTGDREVDDALEPRQCMRCYAVWGPTLQHCGTCGAPLTQEAGAIEQGMHRDISADPRSLQQLTEERLRAGPGGTTP
ncbi:MAG: tyrosine-type recombinase/integrase [Methanomicrobiales archaeon]